MIFPKNPVYVSLKVIEALEIESFGPSVEEPGFYWFKFKDRPLYIGDGTVKKCFTLPEAWIEKHNPEPGWVMIRYRNNYISTCPKEVFEKDNATVDSKSTLVHFVTMIQQHLDANQHSKEQWLEVITRNAINVGISEPTALIFADNLMKSIFGVTVSKLEAFKQQQCKAESEIADMNKILSMINKMQVSAQHWFTEVRVEGDVLVGVTDMGSTKELGSYADFLALERFLEAKK